MRGEARVLRVVDLLSYRVFHVASLISCHPMKTRRISIHLTASLGRQGRDNPARHNCNRTLVATAGSVCNLPMHDRQAQPSHNDRFILPLSETIDFSSRRSDEHSKLTSPPSNLIQSKLQRQPLRKCISIKATIVYF